MFWNAFRHSMLFLIILILNFNAHTVILKKNQVCIGYCRDQLFMLFCRYGFFTDKMKTNMAFHKYVMTTEYLYIYTIFLLLISIIGYFILSVS